MRSLPLTLLALAAACAPIRTDAALRPEPASGAHLWESIGESREGRPVRAMTLGRGGPRVALIAGIHGNEQEGLRHVREVVEMVRNASATVRLIEDVNPDGTAATRRTTSGGVDPNRNWPASNFRRDPRNGPDPLSEPAVAAAHEDLSRFRPELVIVLHSTSRGPFVNYDGPAEAAARAFAAAAGGWGVEASMGYPTPGSIGTYFGVDRGTPILTIEFERGAPAARTEGALLRGLSAVLGMPLPRFADPLDPRVEAAGASDEFRVR